MSNKKRLLDFLGIHCIGRNEIDSMSRDNLRIGVPFTFLMIVLNTIRLIYVLVNEELSACHLFETIFSSSLLYIVDFAYIFIVHYYDKKKYSASFIEGFFTLYLLVHVYVGFQVGLDTYRLFSTFSPFNIAVFFVFLLFNVRPIVTVFFAIGIYVSLNFFRGSMNIPDSEYYFEGIYCLSVLVISVLRYYAGRRIIRNQIKNKEINLQLQDLYKKDQLTGLYNRHALTLDMEDIYNQGLMLIMFDLDDFKKVNDDYGHEVGDELIKEFGHELQKAFVGSRVYRYGGDEFLVLKTCQTEEKVSSDILHRLNSVLVEPMKQSIKTSCGYIFGTPKNYDDYLDLLKEADDCLYKDKRSRKSKNLNLAG